MASCLLDHVCGSQDTLLQRRALEKSCHGSLPTDGAMRLTGLDANSDDVIASRTVSKILLCKRSRALAADCCRPDGNADKPNKMHALMPDYGTTPSRAQAGK